jgi:hypothetical protein
LISGHKPAKPHLRGAMRIKKELNCLGACAFQMRLERENQERKMSGQSDNDDIRKRSKENFTKKTKTKFEPIQNQRKRNPENGMLPQQMSPPQCDVDRSSYL